MAGSHTSAGDATITLGDHLTNFLLAFPVWGGSICVCCARRLASGLIGVTSCIPVPNYDIEYVETAIKRESSQTICESCPAADFAAGWAKELT